MPVLRTFGNVPEDINALWKLASIGEVIVDMRLSTVMGMSIALFGDNSFMISLISSDEHSLRYILDSTEFLT